MTQNIQNKLMSSTINGSSYKDLNKEGLLTIDDEMLENLYNIFYLDDEYSYGIPSHLKNKIKNKEKDYFLYDLMLFVDFVNDDRVQYGYPSFCYDLKEKMLSLIEKKCTNYIPKNSSSQVSFNRDVLGKALNQLEPTHKISEAIQSLDGVIGLYEMRLLLTPLLGHYNQINLENRDQEYFDDALYVMENYYDNRMSTMKRKVINAVETGYISRTPSI